MTGHHDVAVTLAEQVWGAEASSFLGCRWPLPFPDPKLDLTPWTPSPTQVSYPSWGYMFYNDVEPATSSLWELWNGPTKGPGMNSR
jgi:hypothetical protein